MRQFLTTLTLSAALLAAPIIGFCQPPETPAHPAVKPVEKAAGKKERQGTKS